MNALISRTMIHYLLKGERNLSYDKARVIGRMTRTKPIVWRDPSMVKERVVAWETAFPHKVKQSNIELVSNGG